MKHVGPTNIVDDSLIGYIGSNTIGSNSVVWVLGVTMIIYNQNPSEIIKEDVLSQLIDLYPEPVIICNADGIMVFNQAAADLVGTNIANMDIGHFMVDEQDMKNARLRTHLMVKNKIKSATHTYKIQLPNGKLFDAEVISGYVEISGEPALFSVIRDISLKNGELFEASTLQKKLMNKQQPNIDDLNFDVIYAPSQTVSGDFYFHHQLDKDQLIGILGDVSGKGIPAAMNISAFEVMFRTIVSQGTHPHEIIVKLNNLAFEFFKGRYIAVVCYAIDVEAGMLRVAAAGISEFIVSNAYGEYRKYKLKGPFLGMFNDLPFDYIEIDICPKDRFYFYTDGMEFIIEEEDFQALISQENDLEIIRETLRERITFEEINEKSLTDDCTVISFEVKE